MPAHGKIGDWCRLGCLITEVILGNVEIAGPGKQKAC